jgi:hypothetical protein
LEDRAHIVSGGALYTEIVVEHLRVALSPTEDFHGIDTVHMNTGDKQGAQFVCACSRA